MNELLKRILQQNWPFYTHQQLYDMVRTEARGPGALSEADHAWAEFADMMAASRSRIEELLRKAGASWSGLAADSMRGSVTPLAQWADDAGTAGQATRKSIQQVGESFGYAAHSMPEPVRVEVSGNVADIFAGQIDRDRQERQAQEAKQRAVELMQGYSRNAHSAVSSLGVFLPPQEITVRAGSATTSSATVGVRHAAGTIVTPLGAGDTPAPAPGNRETAQDQPETARNGEPRTGPVGAGRTDPGQAATIPAAVPGAAGVVPPSTPGSTEAGGFAGGARVSAGPPAGSPGAERTDRLPGRPAPRPGAGPGGGGRLEGGVTRAHGAPIGVRAGAIGTGPAVTPAAVTRREEDGEHVSPDYLTGYHDEFWELGPPVSPPVIGAEPEAVP